MIKSSGNRVPYCFWSVSVAVTAVLPKLFHFPALFLGNHLGDLGSQSYRSGTELNLSSNPFSPIEHSICHILGWVDVIDKCSSENVLCHNQYIDDIMNAPISEDELSYVLSKAKNGKAGGADAIPTEFYKYSTPNLNKAILALFKGAHRDCVTKLLVTHQSPSLHPFVPETPYPTLQ